MMDALIGLTVVHIYVYKSSLLEITVDEMCSVWYSMWLAGPKMIRFTNVMDMLRDIN